MTPAASAPRVPLRRLRRLRSRVSGDVRLLALWLLVHGLGRAPVRVLDAIAAVGGTLAWLAVPRLRTITRNHMQHVLGAHAPAAERDRHARACVRSAARYYADFARGAHISPDGAFDAADEISGLDAFFAALDRGCGVILVSAHLGDPEFMIKALGAFDFGTLVFTEPLEPRRVHEFVHRIRGRAGVSFVRADLGGVREALAVLRTGGVVAAVSDRDVLGTARTYPFFGEPAAMPSGAVELARRTHATIIHGTVLRSGPGRYRVALERVDQPAPTGDRSEDIASGMRELIAHLEAGIRRAPGQWFVLSPIWSLDQASPAGAVGSSALEEAQPPTLDEHP